MDKNIKKIADGVTKVGSIGEFLDDIDNYIARMPFHQKLYHYLIYCPKSRINSFYYYWRNGLFKRYHLIDTKLPKGKWWDTDNLILHGMMELLVDFVDIESDTVDWTDEDSKPIHQEMMAIYNWWKGYPRRQKDIETTLFKWHDYEKLNKPRGADENPFHKELTNMEDGLVKEEEDMLIRLIKIRRYLWT